MRERGLKLDVVELLQLLPRVAPHAGAWIEIALGGVKQAAHVVAPHAGAWIEIGNLGEIEGYCGLVAPHAGAWIEITRPASAYGRSRRSPCGSVD